MAVCEILCGTLLLPIIVYKCCLLQENVYLVERVRWILLNDWMRVPENNKIYNILQYSIKQLSIC